MKEGRALPNALTNQQFVFHADSEASGALSLSLSLSLSLFDIQRSDWEEIEKERKLFRFRKIQFRLIAQKEK